MGLLISKNSSKWNNYVKNALKDPDVHKQHRFNQETVDYIYHLQQQIDKLELEIAKLKTKEN